ncbi:MAG: hypothetical protein ACK5KU_01985 [Beutenbergiaceae bacterium]
MTKDALDPMTAFYFNVATGEVEQGLVSDWTGRMGPYPSYEAASRARETAAERNRIWDEEDREWDDD